MKPGSPLNGFSSLNFRLRSLGVLPEKYLFYPVNIAEDSHSNYPKNLCMVWGVIRCLPLLDGHVVGHAGHAVDVRDELRDEALFSIVLRNAAQGDDSICR